MDRSVVTQKVKVILDEISPFEEPTSLIVASGDPTYDKVKPILSYIDESLNGAARFCLNALPLTLLSRDVEEDLFDVFIRPSDDVDKVGFVNDFDRYYRLVRVEMREWERPCTMFISSSDPAYLIQQNKHTRSGAAKPIVVYVPELNGVELYSIPTLRNMERAHIFYINENKQFDRIASDIADYVAIKCAEMVFNIFDNENGATRMRNEWQTKLASILQ